MASSTEEQVQEQEEVVSLESEAKVMYSGQICPVIGLGSLIFMSYPRIQWFWSVITYMINVFERE